MKFFMPLPDVSIGDQERFYCIWAKFFGKDVLPRHERIFRVWFTYEGRELLAEVGKSILPGQQPVVAIFGGDPLVVCRLGEEVFTVPSHKAKDAEFFEAD